MTVLPSMNCNLVCERKNLFSHLRMPTIQFSGPPSSSSSPLSHLPMLLIILNNSSHPVLVRVSSSCIKIFFFFWPPCMACGILVPWPGIEPEPTTVKVRSLVQWTAGEFPVPRTFLSIWILTSTRLEFMWCAGMLSFFSHCSWSRPPLPPPPTAFDFKNLYLLSIFDIFWIFFFELNYNLHTRKAQTLGIQLDEHFLMYKPTLTVSQIRAWNTSIIQKVLPCPSPVGTPSLRGKHCSDFYH